MSTEAPWCILTNRWGADTHTPSESQCQAAIADLFNEDGLLEGEASEHGAASLRLGLDDGPMYVIEIDRLGSLTFEQWNDQDYEEEISPPQQVSGVDAKTASEVWALLRNGSVERLKSLILKLGEGA